SGSFAEVYRGDWTRPSGSFAEVYRGDWTRPCAVKKLRGLTRRRQLQDFYREAQILQMLNHNGIVQVHTTELSAQFHDP
ncbi:hypothetical protein T484DRAFT_1792287, partial [Baffinella frigidus]